MTEQMRIDNGDGAVFSPCRIWRYVLYRRWGRGNRIMLWVMLNPSTANEMANDPTVSRCIARAQRLGFDGVDVVNLFAFRATDPVNMKAALDPVGPENDLYIQIAAAQATQIVVAWGFHGALMGRDRQVLAYLPKDLYCLGVTANGAPKHPLYIPDSQPLMRFP